MEPSLVSRLPCNRRLPTRRNRRVMRSSRNPWVSRPKWPTRAVACTNSQRCNSDDRLFNSAWAENVRILWLVSSLPFAEACMPDTKGKWSIADRKLHESSYKRKPERSRLTETNSVVDLALRLRMVRLLQLRTEATATGNNRWIDTRRKRRHTRRQLRRTVQATRQRRPETTLGTQR